LVLATGRPLFDPPIALIIAVVIVVTTVRSIWRSHQELLWSSNVAQDPAHAGEHDPGI